MYDLVDRPITALPAFDRAMLDATRRWVHSFSLAAAVAVDARAVDRRGAALDIVMHALDRGSAADLIIQRPCYAVVEETEAVILSLWRMVRDDRLTAARSLAAALVDDRHVAPLIDGMTWVLADR